MVGRGRELYGLGESPITSQMIAFEVVVADGVAVVVGGAATVGSTVFVAGVVVVGAWVPWCWMRACINP